MYLRRFNSLSIVSIVIALILCSPILFVFTSVFQDSPDTWSHLWKTVLTTYITNSLMLMVLVALGVSLFGVSCAWLVSRCQLPGKSVISVLLMLPMAMPAYIIAYTYSGLLSPYGPVQQWVRAMTGVAYGDYWFPDIHSLGGVSVMLTFVLYPYVFLLARATFLSQSSSLTQASYVLGKRPWQTFWKVTLPMARPAIVTGISLAMMETLADYGTVNFYGVQTFTTGIFRTYNGFGDEVAALQLATMLLCFVLLLLSLERYSRRHIRYYAHADQVSMDTPIKLHRGWVILAWGWCLVPVTIGFVLPVVTLLVWSAQSAQWWQHEFLVLAYNSFGLASLAAILIVSITLIFAYAARLVQSKVLAFSIFLASMGYAIPGTVVAIAVLVSLTYVDHMLIEAIHRVGWPNVDIGLLLSGTLVALLLGYTVRFFAVSFGTVNSALQAIKPSMDASARLLGRTPRQVLLQIHLPLLRGSILTAFLIVFVDVLKELPATLLLRPFNFNTLAVRAYELAMDERLIDAAPASIMIVIVGLLPVIWLNRSIESPQSRNNKRAQATQNIIIKETDIHLDESQIARQK